jgi:hypothetical protein
VGEGRRPLAVSLPEPVRRYLGHALPEGAPASPAVRLDMTGRIKVGTWLPFTAAEEIDGRSFTWRARAAGGLITVVDEYANGAGRTAGRLFGRKQLFDSHDENTARSAAGRTAAESILCPAALRDVDWRAEADDHIVAAWELPPERPELHLTLAPDGAVRTAWVDRWGSAGQKEFSYIPCGATVTAQRRFGPLVIPSEFEVAWWFGTPRAAPFFRATIVAAS